MSSIFNCREDPRFIQGRKFLKDSKFEEAIGMFSSLLQTCVEKYGEFAFEAAEAYYEYGNALVTKEEETPTENLVGPSDGNNPLPADIEIDDKDDTGLNTETPPDTADGFDEQEGEEEEEEEDSDLELAWQNLDIARVILEKGADSDRSLLLSDVYMRLGDLLRHDGEEVMSAVAEYQKALSIRKMVCKESDRLLCDSYFLLATAYIDSSQKSEPLKQKQIAIDYYKLARHTLILRVNDEEVLSAEKIELRDLIDVLNETIDALVLEIESNPQVVSINSLSSTTSIGFGASTSHSSALPVKLEGEISSLKDNSTVVTLQPKKKRKLADEP